MHQKLHKAIYDINNLFLCFNVTLKTLLYGEKAGMKEMKECVFVKTKKHVLRESAECEVRGNQPY